MITSSTDQLLQLAITIAPLTEQEKIVFIAPWQSYTAKRKEILTRTGEPERYIYFVVSGVQRVCYRDDSGREATLVFTYAPSFGGVLDAMLLGQPSKYDYEALTASEFPRAPVAAVREMILNYPGLAAMFNIGVAGAFSGVLERVAELQCYSSEEKFKRLLSRSPHILRHVPHKYLANYLGIDPTNFSKLMNKSW